MLIVYMCHIHGCVFCCGAEEFYSRYGVAACVNKWEIQNWVWAKFCFMPSWTDV